MEFFRKLRTDAEAFLGRLSPRERLLVLVAGSAVAAFVVMLVSMQVSSSIRSRESRIDEKTQALGQIGQLAQGYRRAQAERTLLEAKLRTPVQLMSLVSQIGSRLGIEVNDLRPGQQTTSDKVVEDSVEVSLAGIEIYKLSSLLTELERGPGIVRVRRIAIRNRSDAPGSVDVTLVVADYQLKG